MAAVFIHDGRAWMLAAGNSEKVQKGKNILVWATIGSRDLLLLRPGQVRVRRAWSDGVMRDLKSH